MAKRGLGKGLGALIPTEDASSPGSERAPASTPELGRTDGVESTPAQSASPAADQGAVYAEIPIGSLHANPRQPRTVFDEESLAELTFSITEIGLLQPVVVRRTLDGYELIAGERRLRACQEAGMSTIPAIIRTTDDNEMLREALLENLHRADLNPLEEAAAYSQMLADFGCTQDELAIRVGRKSTPECPTDRQRGTSTVRQGLRVHRCASSAPDVCASFPLSMGRPPARVPPPTGHSNPRRRSVGPSPPSARENPTTAAPEHDQR